MKKEEFLKIFNLYKIYESNTRKDIPFSLRFRDYTLANEVTVAFHFNLNNISISIFMPDLKNIFLDFDIDENDNIIFIRNQNYKNEVFPHLTFEKNLKIDLEFLAGIIYKVLIPKYNLKYIVNIFTPY